MIDIKTQYAGLTLRNPLIVGSSGLTNNAERNKEFEKAGAGAIVLKSLFEEQIEMQSDILMQDSDYPEAADYIRGYVKGESDKRLSGTDPEDEKNYAPFRLSQVSTAINRMHGSNCPPDRISRCRCLGTKRVLLGNKPHIQQ